jgi:hypothetical protein
MGTSTSFRAPAVPRWQAFTAAFASEAVDDRVRSELFNAGGEWEQALAAPAVAEFAVAFARASQVLPRRLAQAERPEEVVRAFVAEARAASAAQGGSAAVAMAERAFAAALSRSIGSGKMPLAEQSTAGAAQQLREARTTPSDAAVSYLREVVAQYARYVGAREMGLLLEGRERPVSELPVREGANVRAAQQRVRALARLAEDVTDRVPPPRGDPEAVRAQWSEMVHQTFRHGRELPRRVE